MPRIVGLLAAVPALALVTACGGASGVEPTADVPTPAAHVSSPAAPVPAAPRASTAPPASTAPRPSTAPVTLAFAGDVHFMGSSGARLAADPATALGPVAATLSDADLAMVNLETAITTGGQPAGKKYVFRAPATAFTALRAAGVDVATMANNHGLDYGRSGLADTLAAIRRTGFPVVGVGADETAAYRPWVTTVHGERVAVLGATDVIDTQLVDAWTAGPHTPGLASAKRLDRLVAAVRRARARADVVVVYVHYGVELQQCPTARQRTVADALTRAGADVVVGSHAHVLLGGGWHGDAYVDYGLGNFEWYAANSPQSSASGVLTLTVRGRQVTDARWTPARIASGVPWPASGTTAAAMREHWQALRACTGLAAHPS